MIEDFKGDKIYFKLFGNLKDELNKINEEIISFSNNKIHLEISEKYGDILVTMNIEKDGDVNLVDNAVKGFLNAFKDYIYAEENVSLQENAVNLLKISRRTLCTSESFTGGGVAKAIVEVPGASEVFYQGFVCYNTLSKEELLNVSESTVRSKSVVSREVAFEMVKGLLENKHCNVGISTTGYASPTGDPSKPCGLCYVGAGLEDRVQVTRHQFFGTRKEIMEQGKNAALFLLNKVLKGNLI